MSYFRKIGDYQTYLGQDSDFHYDFNANSGGGQAFLGGRIIDSSGNLATTSELEGSKAIFALRIRDTWISLADMGRGAYVIVPRAEGSQSMKLSVQGKINPNSLISAALMLPRTCGRNMASSISVSPLTTDNYWLRSMWLDVDRDNHGGVTFIPKDFVFEGGLSKRQGVTSHKDKVEGIQQFFKLDYTKRIEDIVALAEESSLPSFAHNVLGYYRDVYLANDFFDYEKGSSMVDDLMRELSREYCDVYSGYSDPLDFLVNLADRSSGLHNTWRGAHQDINEPHNLIYFGAPGTGKSHQLNKLAIGADGSPGCFREGCVTRVTFHPDYTYAQFVGCYKPYVEPGLSESESDEKLTYRFVPGPFLETYIKAVQNPGENYLLIIEEINRANPAAVFGDIFQLLDRKPDGTSVYQVTTPIEMRKYLNVHVPEYATNAHISDPTKLLAEQERLQRECNRLCLPPNMYIWATMNSADQGVFPMDTAFKRRWDFRYMDINSGSEKLKEILVPVGASKRMVSWDALRRGINKVLIEAGVNEDKLLGPFFISPTRLRDTERFTQTFMDKVLLYLFEDAARTKKSKVFSLEGNVTYTEICRDFNSNGELAFKGMQQLAQPAGGINESKEEQDSVIGEG